MWHKYDQLNGMSHQSIKRRIFYLQNSNPSSATNSPNFQIKMNWKNFIGIPSLLIISSLVNLSISQWDGEVLKFKLAAANLPNCDLDGPSDPFVKLFTGTTGGRHHRDWNKFGQTSVKHDTLNPIWDDVFIYQYVNGTNQKWLFLVLDQDNTWLNPFDDHLGRVQVNVDDYLFQVRKARQNETGAVKPIQLFLTEPIGGALYITPMFD